MKETTASRSKRIYLRMWMNLSLEKLQAIKASDCLLWKLKFFCCLFLFAVLSLFWSFHDFSGILITTQLLRFINLGFYFRLNQAFSVKFIKYFMISHWLWKLQFTKPYGFHTVTVDIFSKCTKVVFFLVPMLTSATLEAKCIFSCALV